MIERVYFREVQRFRQKWLWAVLLGVAALLAYGAVRQLVFGVPWGDKPLGDAALVAMCLAVFASLAWLYLVRLVTEVTDAGVMTHFRWLWRRRLIPFVEIREHRAVTYKPIADYGGWGIRYDFAGGKAYNVSGDRGVQLELTGGGRLLVGSQRAEELDRAIDEATRAVAPHGAAGLWLDD